MHWWLRTFIARYAPAEGRDLPQRLLWPIHAQFAVSAGAVRQRSREFWKRNLALASMPSPLKPGRTRREGESCASTKDGRCVMTVSERRDKWRNFGPWVVDLGPSTEARRRNAPDASIAGLHGLDLASMFERLWFVILDPQLEEAAPRHPMCYSLEAIASSPVRCEDGTCAEKAPA